MDRLVPRLAAGLLAAFVAVASAAAPRAAAAGQSPQLPTPPPTAPGSPVASGAPASPNGSPSGAGAPVAPGTTGDGAAAVPMPPPVAPPDYLIGPQDVLRLVVWDQEGLNGAFTVEGDGTFTFPLVGRVKAGGLTLRQLETELRRLLQDGYFKDPQLSVGIEQYRSQRLFVVGEVRSPGTYPLTGGMTLIEAIARAGSTLPSASDQALVVRSPKGKAADGPTLPTDVTQADAVPVDLRGLQSGVIDQNVQLRDGDTIFVPRAETVHVFGQVKVPGAYAITQSTTVMQALSLAGGVTERGATGRIKIMRVVDGKQTEVRVQLTDTVRPGDTIIVPERFF